MSPAAADRGERDLWEATAQRERAVLEREVEPRAAWILRRRRDRRPDAQLAALARGGDSDSGETVSVWHLYVVRVPARDRDAILKHLHIEAPPTV